MDVHTRRQRGCWDLLWELLGFDLLTLAGQTSLSPVGFKQWSYTFVTFNSSEKNSKYFYCVVIKNIEKVRKQI